MRRGEGSKERGREGELLRKRDRARGKQKVGHLRRFKFRSLKIGD